ncbi:hypothetical protein EJK15_52695 [Nonomuraea basaltis]|nr:hypothetical protein EJK15_52695 [Nonomuraea basaltis]
MRGASASALIWKLSPIISGWASYYRTVVFSATFNALDDYVGKLAYPTLRGGYPRRYWRQDHGGVLFRRVLDGYLHMLRSLTLLGHDVISEAVITPPMLDHYLALFEGIPVLFVGIRCPLEEVERREQGRTDRMTSVPPLDEPVHAHGCYDVEVDTSVHGPAEVAKLIVAALPGGPFGPRTRAIRSRAAQEGRCGGDVSGDPVRWRRRVIPG